MKKIKNLFKEHSPYLLILTLCEGILSLVCTLSFVYSDSLSYNDSLIYNSLGIEKLLETLYSSTFWALLLLILAFIFVLNITCIKYKNLEPGFISICLWVLMFILSINLTKSLMDNLIPFVTDKQIFLPFSTMALSRTARSYNKISTIYEEMMALYIVEIFMYTLINFIKKYNRSIRRNVNTFFFK